MSALVSRRINKKRYGVGRAPIAGVGIRRQLMETVLQTHKHTKIDGKKEETKMERKRERVTKRFRGAGQQGAKWRSLDRSLPQTRRNRTTSYIMCNTAVNPVVAWFTHSMNKTVNGTMYMV